MDEEAMKIIEKMKSDKLKEFKSEKYIEKKEKNNGFAGEYR
jgi:hypothetical protein